MTVSIISVSQPFGYTDTEKIDTIFIEPFCG